MPLRRIWFLLTLAMVAVCAALQSASAQSNGIDSTGPNGKSDRPALGAQEPPRSLLPVQSKATKNLAVGKLLVASRDLGDPQFAQTVVLLVRYDEQGVLGLILNRRTDVPISEVVRGFKAAKDRSDPIYVGGPVMPAVFALFRSSAKVDGAEHVFDSIYLISDKPAFEQAFSARPDPGIFHVYLGYAGWTKSQLEKEVELGAWYIFPAEASTVFSGDPDSLWLEMIRKTEIKLALGKPIY